MDHLNEVGLRDDLLNLLKAEWIKAKWDAFGSYSALLHDFDVAYRACLREPRNDAAIAGLALARQTSRELMQSFPADLLSAWVEQGEIQRTLELLTGLSDVRGYSIESLIAVAEALLNIRGNHTKQIEDILFRALSLLPCICISFMQLESLYAIVKILMSGQGINVLSHPILLEKAEAFALTIEDPALMAAATGLVAHAWVCGHIGRPHAQKLLNMAQEYFDKIEFPPDRVFALARLLPVLRNLKPEAVLKTVEKILENLEDPFESSSLGKNALGDLILSWTSGQIDPVEKDEIALWIEKLALMTHDDVPGLDSCMVIALCRLGLREKAASLIDRTWEFFPVNTAWTVLGAISELYEAVPLRTREWVVKAGQYTASEYHSMEMNRISFISMLVIALATTGEWEKSFQMIDNLPPDEAVETRIKCIAIAERYSAANHPVLQSIVRKLVMMPAEADADKRARCFACAARVLRQVNHTDSVKYLRNAEEICLTTLPEGDIDDLLTLLAVAQHEDGDYDSVEETLKRMKWPSVTADVLKWLIASSPESRPEIILRYMTLLEALIRSDDEALFSDVLRHAISAADHVIKIVPQAALKLLNGISEALYIRSLLPDEQIKFIAAVAQVHSKADSIMGLREMDDLINRVKDILDQGYRIDVKTLIDIAKKLSNLEDIDTGTKRERLKKLYVTLKYFPELSDMLEFRCGFAISLSVIDPADAVDQLRKQVGKISLFNKIHPGAPHFSRAISELTGRLVGPCEKQARATEKAGEAIIAISSHCPHEAKELLFELLQAIQIINSPNDLTQALMDFFAYGGKATADFFKIAAPIFSQAVDMAAELLDEPRKTSVLNMAIRMYSTFSDFKNAQSILERFSDEAGRKGAETILSIARERAEVGTLSIFEQAFVDSHQPDFYWSVLHCIKCTGETEEVLIEIGKMLAREDSKKLEDPHEQFTDRNMLIRIIKAMLPPARALGGTKTTASIIESIRDFEQRLLDAGRLIGQVNDKQPHG